MSEDLGASDHEAFRSYIEGEAWLAQSALMTDTVDRSGRRRIFEPHVLMLFFHGATAVWKSARKTAAHFADADHWAFLRRIVQEQHPNDESLWLPAVAPRRHHYLYFRRHHLDPKVKELQEVFEEVASRQALAVGLCDADGAGSWTHPAKTRTLTADGKVITPLYRSKKPTKVNRATGEIRNVRFDPDARTHKSGDNRWLWATSSRSSTCGGLSGTPGWSSLSMPSIRPRETHSSKCSTG